MVNILKWPKEVIHEAALEYSTRGEFRQGNKLAYSAAVRHQCLDEVCSHMIPVGEYRTGVIYIHEVSGVYYVGITALHRIDIRDRQHRERKTGGYAIAEVVNTYWVTTAIRDGVFDITTSLSPSCHFDYFTELSSDGPNYENVVIQILRDDYGLEVINQLPGGGMGNARSKWTLPRMRQVASSYTTRRFFELGDRNAYQAAVRLGVIEDICGHMKPQRNSWTLDILRERANQHASRWEFQQQDSAAYQAAYRRKLLNEFFPEKSAEGVDESMLTP